MMTSSGRPGQNPRVLVVFLGLMLATACGGNSVGNDGDLVGGSCRDSGNCADICLSGGDWPEGMCSVACRDDFDCPSETACIDDEGGVCLLLCDFDTDCRRGYECDDESRRGHPGNATVCVKD